MSATWMLFIPYTYLYLEKYTFVNFTENINILKS